MFHPLIDPIINELSGLSAFHHVQNLSSYHRIQASPGFRQAAHYAAEAFTRAGLETDILTYPAETDKQYWSQIMFQEWDCQKGELRLLSPERKRLASFLDDKISLIQRSTPTPPQGIEAKIILIEDPEDPRSYQGKEVEGNIVFASGDLERIRKLAVEEYSAVGIITDRITEQPPVRHRMDIPEARQYTSFWWTGNEKPCFGFVLSPKEGEQLRKQIKKAAEESEAVKAKALVKSRLYDGKIEVVSAAIKGQTPEEILIIAHLCHPQTSANDNASGSALAIEIARTLQLLYQEEKIPKPQKTIRFLLVPEFTGTYAYLAAEEANRQKISAAINLDMVGQNQELCQSTLLIERPPLSTPSFSSELLEVIIEEIGKEGTTLGGQEQFPLFRHRTVFFSGGSDHGILADPSVNIPTPMLIQWPDKYYHTNEDTLDKVDPKMLGRVGKLASLYTAFLAQIDCSQAVWLAAEMTARFPAYLHQEIRPLLDKALADSLKKKPSSSEDAPTHNLACALEKINKKSTFLLQRKKEDLRSLKRLLPHDNHAVFEETLTSFDEQMRQTLADEQCRSRMISRHLLPAPGSCCPPELTDKEKVRWEKQAKRLIPRRIYPGPIMARGHLSSLSKEEQEAYRQCLKNTKNAYTLTSLAVYWMDGEKTLSDIADLVELETNRRVTQLLVEYTTFMEKAGLISFKE